MHMQQFRLKLELVQAHRVHSSARQLAVSYQSQMAEDKYNIMIEFSCNDRMQMLELEGQTKMLEIKEIICADCCWKPSSTVLWWMGKELPDESTIEQEFGWRWGVQTTLHAEAHSPDPPEHEIVEEAIEVVQQDVELSPWSDSESSISSRRESGQRSPRIRPAVRS